MGLSLSTAMEICNHPHDLCVAVGGPGSNGKYSVEIGRGPGHNYKLLLSAYDCFETREKVVESIKDILTTCVEAGSKEMQNPDSLVAQICNPQGLKPEEADILSQARIDKIIELLGTQDQVDTSKDELLVSI